MKTLKTILAWLDWSNYCFNYSYNFPNNLCSLFWRTFWTITTLPLTYVTHLWNIFQPKYYFWDEMDSDSKMNIYFGFIIHLLIGFVGSAISINLIEKNLNWNWFLMSDPFLLNYIKVMGIGIISGGIITLIIIRIVAGIIFIKDSITKYFKNLKHSETTDYKPKRNVLKEPYKSIKDKYCPLIDWSIIRNKEINN